MTNFCSKCGIQIYPGIHHECPNQIHYVYTKPQKSKITAGLLALLLGGIGAHKFYLNKPGMGVLYILFCWTYVPAIIALIEGIMYLSVTDEEFFYKYVTK